MCLPRWAEKVGCGRCRAAVDRARPTALLAAAVRTVEQPQVTQHLFHGDLLAQEGEVHLGPSGALAAGVGLTGAGAGATLALAVVTTSVRASPVCGPRPFRWWRRCATGASSDCYAGSGRGGHWLCGFLPLLAHGCCVAGGRCRHGSQLDCCAGSGHGEHLLCGLLLWWPTAAASRAGGAAAVSGRAQVLTPECQLLVPRGSGSRRRDGWFSRRA